MLRQILKVGNQHLYRSCSRWKSDTTPITGKTDTAHEIDYFYKQDKELFKILKKKTEDEVKIMQEEIQAMRAKIDENHRNITENLRFLKDLENDLSGNKNKEH